MNKYIYWIAILGFLYSCGPEAPTTLPYIGKKKMVDGVEVNHKIPAFEMLNQDSMVINNESLSDYIYVADFFFMSCPSICPKVKKQMMRINEKYADNPKIKLISHTLDPKRDSVDRLKQYATNLGADHDKWYFLRHEDKDVIFELANEYFVVAYEDPDAPGGFDHSGKILLIDQKGHVRSFAEGTEEESVTKFLDDIDLLLKEVSETPG